ncbi:MAG: HEAT repeat domain-containing protein [Planctomycetota bacterium]|nr:HEAT repeat domain-containing protein [Planctomycetota bacterium]
MVSVKSLASLAVSMGLLLGICMAAVAQSFDELVSQATGYKLGQSRRPLEAIQDQVIKNATDGAKRAEMAKKLASLFSNPDATFECKDFACRQLYIIGTAAEVPALAKLLGDEQLSHMGRYVLERMEDRAAGAALREAMGTTQGRLQIGVVNSVGNRRDAQAVGRLKPMLTGQDVPLACAAAAALGKIGGAEALAALTAAKSGAAGELKDAVIDGYIRCADELLAADKKAEAGALYAELYVGQPARIRMAALRGMVAADPAKTTPVLLALLKSAEAGDQAVAAGYVARQMPGQEITNAFVAALNGLSPGAQVLLIDALGTRGDVSAKAAIVAAAKSEEEAIRVAAIQAIGSLGGAEDVGMLGAAAGKAGRTGDAARVSLARLKGADVDAAVQNALKNASPEVRVELIKALAARGASSAVGALLDLGAKDESEAVRSAALSAVGTLAGEKDYGVLVERLVSAKSDGERDAAKAAVAAVAGRMNNKDASSAPVVAAMAKGSTAAKIALIGTLCRIGGEKALDAVRGGLKDTDATVQEAATRAITEWPDALAIADMMAIAKSGAEKQKVLGLRGLVRLISKPDARMPAAQALALYKQMMELCSRPEEKRLVLSGLADVKDAGALEMALPFLTDATLRNEAATAINKIARAIGANKAAAKAALQKVVGSDVAANLKKQAQDLLDKGQ